MARSRRRVSFLGLYVLIVVSCLAVQNSFFVEASSQNPPKIVFRLEENPKNLGAGEDFWAVFTVEQNFPVDGLASFQCDIEFNPKLIAPVGAEPGGMAAAKGWTADLKWNKSEPSERANVSLRAPSGENKGLSGCGVLLRVRFHALEEAGGPVHLQTVPGERWGSYTMPFTGIASNIGGDDIPVVGPFRPQEGLGSVWLMVAPCEPRIVAANSLRQTVRVSLDRATDAYRDSTDGRWNVTLHAWGAGEGGWIALPIREVIPIGDDAVLQLNTGADAGFAPGGILKLSYTAERLLHGGRQTLAGETPAFVVAPDEQSPAVDIGRIKLARLSYQGKELKSYSSRTPPTLEAKVEYERNDPWAYEWMGILFGPDGSYLDTWVSGPFAMLGEGARKIRIDPAWPDGEYRLLLVAFNSTDGFRTSFTTASIRFTVIQD